MPDAAGVAVVIGGGNGIGEATCRLMHEHGWQVVVVDKDSRAAERVETALSGLDDPLGRYLVELEADQAEGRSWYGEPGRAELVEWQPVLSRAGVHASPVRVAQAYLELAVLVRALEGLATAARMRSAPNPSDLWAGLFDLRENLLNGALEDLRALAA